jgi:ABC-2 type transport system ATP-binding protein
MKHVLRADRVTKLYGRQVAVAEASFTVPAGCVCALLGENGAGKTTLVRMLLGLLAPTSGTLDTFGVCPVTHGEALRRRIGYLPEQPTLYEWMTPAELGWFAAGFYPPGFEERFRRRLAMFRTPHDRRMASLSKGMRAKVALALAMAHEPELLVLDEPTSGLDTLVRREFLESMVDWVSTGRTVLLSSHLIDEVERVADYVVILREGQLLLAERLDALKQGVREITVTLATPTTVEPELGGICLHRRQRGRQWQLLVRGVEEDDVAKFAARVNVSAIETRSPSLEEIFIALMQAPAETDPPLLAASEFAGHGAV